MLEAIGLASSAELFDDISENLRDSVFDLTAPLSELEFCREFQHLSAENANTEEFAAFLREARIATTSPQQSGVWSS
jgi:glycine cleavage system pyridoxal-binding protein P